MIPKCKQNNEELKSINQRGLYKLYEGSSSIVGNKIKLSTSINNFSFLLLSTGSVGTYTYLTNIAIPFSSQINNKVTHKPVWRNNDTISINTLSGKITLAIVNETELEINSVTGDEALRAVIGVIL